VEASLSFLKVKDVKKRYDSDRINYNQCDKPVELIIPGSFPESN